MFGGLIIITPPPRIRLLGVRWLYWLLFMQNYIEGNRHGRSLLLSLDNILHVFTTLSCYQARPFATNPTYYIPCVEPLIRTHGRGARTRVPISTSSVQGHENKSIMHLIGLMRLSLIGLKCKYFFPFNICLLCFTWCLRVDRNDWSVVILGHLWAYSDLWLKKNVDGGVKQGGPPTSSAFASNFLTWCLRFPVFF